MPVRETPPVGAPCWADLSTPDVEGSRRFYAEILGWEPQEPSPEFGGYFMFNRNGVPVAGGSGPMADAPATNRWKVYLATVDITKTVELAGAAGAEVVFPPGPVADLGTQTVIIDPGGAEVGAWQPGSFPGSTVLGEHGAPYWFELITRDHAGAVAFYRSVFFLDANVVSDTREFRYTTLRAAGDPDDLGGIMDGASFLPPDQPVQWSIYWQVDDVDAAAAHVGSLGGSVVAPPRDSPYGRMASVTDPTGASFNLATPPAS